MSIVRFNRQMKRNSLQYVQYTAVLWRKKLIVSLGRNIPLGGHVPEIFSRETLLLILTRYSAVYDIILF